jgi:hypothetical protein
MIDQKPKQQAVQRLVSMQRTDQMQEQIDQKMWLHRMQELLMLKVAQTLMMTQVLKTVQKQVLMEEFQKQKALAVQRILVQKTRSQMPGQSDHQKPEP